MADLIYNKSLEVTQEQYIGLRKKFSGIIATRKEKEKYFIKLLIMKYKLQVEKSKLW